VREMTILPMIPIGFAPGQRDGTPQKAAAMGMKRRAAEFMQ
jgi:hypothetical protein